MSSPPFTLELDQPGRTLQVSGELDEPAVAALRDAIDEATGSFTRPLVVDLSEVVFLPSAGVGVLATVLERGAAAGHRVELVAADGTIAQRVLTICALPFRAV